MSVYLVPAAIRVFALENRTVFSFIRWGFSAPKRQRWFPGYLRNVIYRILLVGRIVRSMQRPAVQSSGCPGTRRRMDNAMARDVCRSRTCSRSQLGAAAQWAECATVRAAANLSSGSKLPGDALWTRYRQLPHCRRSPSRLTRNVPAPYARNDTNPALTAGIARELQVTRHIRETIHQPDVRRGSARIQVCFANEGAPTMKALVTMVHGIRARRPRFRPWGQVALIARCSGADPESSRRPLASADVDVLTGLACGLERIAQ